MTYSTRRRLLIGVVVAAAVLVVVRTAVGVTLEPVTMPTTVIGPRLVPLVKGVLLSVQLIVWPAGAPHTQSVP